MQETELKHYLSDKYQGWESFRDNVVLPIFGEDNYEDNYETELLDNIPERRHLADSTGIKSIKQCASVYVNGEPLYIFDITVADRIIMKRNRVGVQTLIRSVMEHYSGAFMIFHYEEENCWQWRFSFSYKGTNDEDSTDRKRYTFLLGQGQSCRTAAQNFCNLYKERIDNKHLQFNNIINAFSVEALSDEFFNGYKAIYADIIFYITGKRMVKQGNKWEEVKEGRACRKILDEFSDFADPEKAVRDYVKKLMGRLVFLQFLQKKGWLGVPLNEDWGNGDPEFLQNLFANTKDKDNFVDNVLEVLFKDLNTERKGDKSKTFNFKIPYLNGGLFEPDATDETTFPLPARYMENMLEFFSRYNFTIDENDPNDAEIGVDPEMLGRIFENLLEDNKDKGAFYTPKEIVQYMCRESLIAYLQTEQNEEYKESIRQFVTTHNAEILGRIREDIDKKLQDVKICDPAIGSGAFPMGLLKELYQCRSAIESIHEDKASEIKKHIIQNNIYGVDIEKGAVDIARLRFWLSLIVDEKTPHALPNLDFKIMQGNSLLEQYKGADLSTTTESKYDKEKGLSFYDNMVDAYRKELRNMLAEYYECVNHQEKGKLRKSIINNVKEQLSEQCVNVDFGDLDLAGNNQFFLWHTWFYDVFLKGGFDIVIGNPPYIDSETMVKVMPKERELYAKKFACASGNWDMFMIFIEFSISLLKENGIFSNIIPNKLIAAKYGVELRKYLSKKHVLEIRDYSRIDVFEDAAVYPITIVLRNYDIKDSTLFTIMENRVDVKQSNKANSNDLAKNDYWDPFFRNTAIFKLISKINLFNPLKDLPVEVLGAATVADAYEIKKIVQDSNSQNGFKLINSGTVDPYLPYWGIRPCRYIKGSYIYPKVPAEDLKNYSEVRFNQASSPKIIVASMTTRYEACLDICGEFIAGKSTTIILGDTKQLYKLTAIINSKLASYWLNIVFNSLKMSGGAINIGRNELQILPIPNKDVDFMPLVNKIMESKASSSLNDTTALEHEIDMLVYDMYGLTEDEIKIVEGTK